MDIKTIDILGVRVSAVNPVLAKDFVKTMVKERHKGYICIAPVATLVDCQHVPGYRNVINQAVMVTPDGSPVAWLCRFKGAKQVSRTYGPHLMLSLCQEPGLKHFFYGSNDKVLRDLKIKLERQYSGINIAGMYAPDFSTQVNVENSMIIDMINTSQPDIIWVALGSPKQDFWMYRNQPYLNAPVLVGVGAAFDFISGHKPQAPPWIQHLGLEWFFRLCCEPKRLWKRYLVGNSLFFYYVIKEFMRLKSKI